jgi:hypothetical protein
MPYMTFSQYTGDTSNMEADFELPRQKLTALGASRVTGSVALTGDAAGSFTIASIWETADGYFDARPQVVGDPEVRTLMQERSMSPVQTAFTEVYGQSGSPEGKYAVSVVAAVAAQTPEAWQSVVEAASNVMLAHGVNGMRFTRAIAAGQQSGVHIALAYTDSLDDYLAASAASAADSDFVAAMSNAEGQIVLRQFNRMI